MEFSEGAWWILAGGIGIAITIIGYFLKRTISKTDDHDNDINEIKRTYVTKDELTGVKKELRDDLATMQQDIKDIKDNTLTKKDFYRTQTTTDSKIDRIYDLLINQGGHRHE